MLFKTVSALAFMAVTVQAAAEPLIMMSERNVFGLMGRAGPDGYQPTQTFCGTGSTCAEACGAGFLTCPSTDKSIHCYNADAKQLCCSDGSGNSCDAGFFCAGSTKNGTLCCPEGQSLDACSKAYGISGGLSSVAPTSPASKPTPASTAYFVTTNTSSYGPTAYPTAGTATISAGATYPGTNATAGTAAPTATKAVVNAGDVARPAGAVLALAAAVFAALL